MKIFLSYGHDANAPLVLRVKQDLERLGHAPWVDSAQIKGGDDWRRSITDGLLASDAVVAFLSQHSVRDPGVCRDELAIALGVKGGNIVTVLLEDPALVAPPVSLTHIQWLDLSDWRSRHDADGSQFGDWYVRKLDELIQALASKRGFDGEASWLAERLRPVSSAARIGELLRSGFTGRRWLFEEIEQWRTGMPQQRVLCITGEPGIGKSAIAAWLAHAHSSRVVAAHFCQHDQPDRSEPGQVIRSIAFQIAVRLPDYRRFLIDAVQRLERNGGTRRPRATPPAGPAAAGSLPTHADLAVSGQLASQLFDALLAEPAHFSIDGQRERYIVVIDALDEAGEELTRLLAQHQDKLPAWLGFLVTSRPQEANIRHHLAALLPHALSADDQRNRGDALEYLRQWLARLPDLDELRRQRLRETLLQASAGNFLYLRLAHRLAESHGIAALLEHPDRAPAGLESLYHTFFARQFPDTTRYETDQAPLLRLLAASRHAIPLELARAILGIDEERLHKQVLLPLGSLLHSASGAIGVYHESVRDWLRDPERSNRYFVSPGQGHGALAIALWKMTMQPPVSPDEAPAHATLEMPAQFVRATEQLQTSVVPSRADWENRRDAAVRFARHVDNRQDYLAALDWWRMIYLLDARHLGALNVRTAQSGAMVGMFLEHEDAAAARLHLERSLAAYRQLVGERHADTGIVALRLAQVLTRLGDFGPLADLLQAAATALLDADPERSADAAEALHLLALNRMQRDPAAARAAAERALQISRRVNGVDVRTAGCVTTLSKILRAQGNAWEAHALLEHSVQMFREQLGEDDPSALALADELATLLIDQGNLEAAQPLLEHSLAVRLARHGEDNAGVASARQSLASIHQARGEHLAACELYRQATTYRRYSLGPDHPLLANHLVAWGMSYRALEDWNNARTLLQEAAAIYRKQLPECTDQLTACLNNLALVLQASRELDPAERLFEEALTLARTMHGERHANVAVALSNLGLLLKERGDARGARLKLEQAHAIMQQVRGNNHPQARAIAEELALLPVEPPPCRG